MKKSRKAVQRPDPPAPRREMPPRVAAVAIVTIVVVAGIVRTLAATGELWLDEIWSLSIARLITSPLGVFTELHHDNNHHLNTLYLSLLPHAHSWVTHRVHVLIASTATVVLAAAIARRSGRTHAVAAAVTTGASFLLTSYGSEARGYALAVFFAFAGVLAAHRSLETRRIAWAALFGVVSVLGILSHLTFLHALPGLLAWASVRAARQHPKRLVAVIVTLGALPFMALAVLYWIDLRHLVFGGGPVTSASDVLARTMSLVVGGPEDGPWRAPAALACAAAAIASLVAMRRAGTDLWILCGVTGVLAPLITILFVDSNLLFERYFLVSAAFVLLSFAWLIARVAKTSALWASLLSLAFIIPNALQTSTLVARGRGSYLPALALVNERSTQRPATIGSDHDFRHGRVVAFYRPLVSGGASIEYHLREEWAAAGPEWMFVHSQAPGFVPQAELAVAGGRRYRLAAFYPSAPLSGWHLAVYHNALARR